MKTASARSGDVELSYSVEGDGAETVLLIMGLGGRAADWGTELPRALSERYRVVRFDNRGTGGSTVVNPGFSLEDMANDAVAVLDAVGAEKAHVMGISMGGMISQLVALGHAARIDKLVLMSTHFGGRKVVPPTPEAMKLFDPAEFDRVGRDAGAMMRRTLEIIAAPGWPERDPEAVDALVDNARRQPTPPAGFMGQFQAILQSDRSERLGDIPHPTLVLHGKQDTLIPVDNGRLIAERIPSARLELLDDCGHQPHWEKPDDVKRLVVEFLAG
jgi:pimeloyl-ACP methyl ester carboxylesterase